MYGWYGTINDQSVECDQHGRETHITTHNPTLLRRAESTANRI